MKEIQPAKPTIKQQASATATAIFLPENAGRKALSIYNDSTAVLYVAFGPSASSTNYTVQLSSGAYYEAPWPCYTGVLSGIWASANGYAYITEVQ